MVCGGTVTLPDIQQKIFSAKPELVKTVEEEDGKNIKRVLKSH